MNEKGSAGNGSGRALSNKTAAGEQLFLKEQWG
jgi:hypothetical protein